MEADNGSGEGPEPRDVDFAQLPESMYNAVVQRRTAFDKLAWQAPVLSLTAQAFLFTVALSPGSSLFARLIASGLAAVAALGSIALFGRHASGEHLDSEWLEKYEKARYGVFSRSRP
jgi:hypothetical protein